MDTVNISNLPDLTAPTTARLSHDLASPLGAIGNGLELMELSGHAKTPEFELTQQAFQSALARLRLFRIAFGSVFEKSPTPLEILDDWALISKVKTIGFDPQTAGEAQLFLLVLMCFDSSLPQGGDLIFRKTTNAITARATAKRVLQNNDLWDKLNHVCDDHQAAPSNIHFSAASRCINAQGYSAETELTNTSITLHLHT